MDEKIPDINLDKSSSKSCPYCKEEIPVQAVKCMHCAKWIDKEIKKSAFSTDKTLKICSDCGTENPDYANFCRNCGKEFELKERYDEDKLKEESIVKLCPYCDSEVHYKALKCRYCGEWIEKKENLNEITKPVKDTVISETVREGIRYLREFNRWR